MNLNIKRYHRNALNAAFDVCKVIEEADEERERSVRYHLDLLKSGRIIEKGYHESLDLAAERYEEKVEAAAAEIKKIQAEFSALMDGLGAMNGDKIDDATMKLLDSGIEMSAREWQDLATRYRDNAVMTRILKQHYDRRPVKKGLTDGFYTTGGGELQEQNRAPEIVFGQLPEERKKAFDSFCNVLYNSSKSGTVLPEYVDRESYWNDLARKSLFKMSQCGDETFDKAEIEEVLPVETQIPRRDVW